MQVDRVISDFAHGFAKIRQQGRRFPETAKPWLREHCWPKDHDPYVGAWQGIR